MAQPAIRITHEDFGTSGRYAAQIPGADGEAELTWHSGGPGVIVADHTLAPDTMRGSGVAMALVQRLIDDARRQGMQIVPSCTYVRAQFDRHPEWAELRAGIA
ncbi:MULTISPECIES: GNAT family N-acetyltransferase [Paracoccus]|jgi:predicted GNAT family acetyltransferase|uniref:N-acetyltransferase n=1 Tax=Paracoccus litorisediminis TaxID=2006130 RepID=A0A844HL11_9RHOB|nr:MULTISPECIES: GNAT family N-acetyltransferase [Paracoccus]MBD9528172.1 N-acetyltransferase [Paracoccus sp. PAR01]MTH59124.1 N-acetyltransferase [Paracoccus litorisediminis]